MIILISAQLNSDNLNLPIPELEKESTRGIRGRFFPARFAN